MRLFQVPVILRFLGLLMAGSAWVLVTEPGSALSAEPNGEQEPPAPYMRVFKPDTNTIELQIALREFRPSPGTSGPVIWLAGVAHIGESNYFAGLQTFLDKQKLVLFEGVGMEESGGNPGQSSSASGQPVSDPSALQPVLARSLGLEFQLEAIQYQRDHFQNSDLSLGKIQRLMMRQIEEGGLEDSFETNPEFVALMAAMQGSSWIGALMHVGAKLLGSSPKLKAMTRLMLVEILGQVEGDLSQMEGLPSDVQELLRVLIQARNQKVIQDLQASLSKPAPPSSIAVFYGAAHMDDMEKRLTSTLGYRPGTNQWRTAISVNPSAAGLSPAEISTIRSLIQWQLDAFKGPAPGKSD